MKTTEVNETMIEFTASEFLAILGKAGVTTEGMGLWYVRFSSVDETVTIDLRPEKDV